MAIALSALTLLVTGGCTEQPSPRLIDETGTVAEIHFHVSPDDGLALSHEDQLIAEEAGAVTVEPPPGWDIRIGWPVAPCQRAPTVRVAGTDGQITAIHVDYGPQLGPGECPSALVIYGVDLKTAGTPADDLVVTVTAS
jgi:hypothetical protein